MASSKRQRKKQNQAARRAALEAARRRQRRRRLFIRVGVLAVGVVVLAALISWFASRGDETDVASGATTTTTVAFGTQECPPPEGAAERRTSFDGPFRPECTDPSRTYIATIETDVGNVSVVLDPQKAPVAVNNFVSLARYRFYEGSPFHRVIKDFVVQGGKPDDSDNQGPGFTFRDELPAPGDYAEGSVALANRGPDTNGSQFFIVTSEAGADRLVAASEGEARYTIFGRVTNGMDVVKRIEADGSEGDGPPAVVHRIVRVGITEH